MSSGGILGTNGYIFEVRVKFETGLEFIKKPAWTPAARVVDAGCGINRVRLRTSLDFRKLSVKFPECKTGHPVCILQIFSGTLSRVGKTRDYLERIMNITLSGHYIYKYLKL